MTHAPRRPDKAATARPRRLVALLALLGLLLVAAAPTVTPATGSTSGDRYTVAYSFAPGGDGEVDAEISVTNTASGNGNRLHCVAVRVPAGFDLVPGSASSNGPGGWSTPTVSGSDITTLAGTPLVNGATTTLTFSVEPVSAGSSTWQVGVDRGNNASGTACASSNTVTFTTTTTTATLDQDPLLWSEDQATQALVATGTIALQAVGGSGDGAVTYELTNDNGGACSLAGGTTVSATAPGTCTARATKAASGQFGSQTSAPLDLAFLALPTLSPSLLGGYHVGQDVRLSGSNWQPGSEVTLTLREDVMVLAVEPAVDASTPVVLAVETVDEDGDFDRTFAAPDVDAGPYRVVASGNGLDGTEQVLGSELTILEPLQQDALVLTAEPDRLLVGRTAQLRAEGGSTGFGVTYRVVGGACEVDDAGVVSSTTAGACQLQAAMPGGIAEPEQDRYLDVDSNVVTVTFVPAAAATPVGGPFGEVRVADVLAIAGSSWQPGSTVTISFASDPIELGTEIVGDDGTFAASYPTPDVPPGPHTVVIEGTNLVGEGARVELPVTVVAANAPDPEEPGTSDPGPVTPEPEEPGTSDPGPVAPGPGEPVDEEQPEAPAASSPDTGSSELAKTGVDAASLVLLALLMLQMGAGLVARRPGSRRAAA